MKYQNKDGISLNYTSDDIHTNLVKEVIGEAISMLKQSRTIPAIDFLKENFDLKTVEDYIDE